MKNTKDFENYLYRQYVNYISHKLGYNSTKADYLKLAYEEFRNMSEYERELVLDFQFDRITLNLTNEDNHLGVIRTLKDSVLAHNF